MDRVSLDQGDLDAVAAHPGNQGKEFGKGIFRTTARSAGREHPARSLQVSHQLVEQQDGPDRLGAVAVKGDRLPDHGQGRTGCDELPGNLGDGLLRQAGLFHYPGRA